MHLTATRYLCLLVVLGYLCNGCGALKKLTQRSENKELNEETQAIIDSIQRVETVNRMLQEKYGRYLNISADSIINIKLYGFIDKWLNTPYKWGGTNEQGIDCSAFLQRLFSEVYGLNLPRTSMEQLLSKCVELFRSPKYLCEGDIIFFKTDENKLISHVGIYLRNSVFVNCSSSQGVSLASLNDRYWKSRFRVAGRVKLHLARKA